MAHDRGKNSSQTATAGAAETVVGFEISSDAIHGAQGGFLGVRRLHLRNRRADGTQSAPYICDFIARPKGIDAVVVAVWHRDPEGEVQVLLRDGLRPALSVGRTGVTLPIPDHKSYLAYTEIVAGIIEQEDNGVQAVRARAAAEVLEEAGYTVAPQDVQFLGAGTFPSAGSMSEKYWLMSVQVLGPAEQGALQGDGSPMEEGARTRWLALDAAIAACVAGEIEDAKTELTLRRLRDALR